MSYTYSYFHIIFHTLHNNPTISEKHEKMLYGYIWGFCKNKNVTLIRIGGMPNHIHLLVNLPSNLTLADFVRELKYSSNRWLKTNPNFPLFEGWSEGYAGLSCGPNDIDRIVNYIKNQKQHHGKVSFGDEIRTIFDEYGIEADERFFGIDWLQ